MEGVSSTWYSYYLSGNTAINFNKGDILSCIFYTEFFYGGTHGGHLHKYLVFDLKTGLLLKEADIFKEGYKNELNLIILNKIAEQNEVKTAEELVELGFFGAVELNSNDNFLLNENGITYLYNEYEIAPYVMGATTVFIPYKELKNILKEQSPVTKFID